MTEIKRVTFIRESGGLTFLEVYAATNIRILVIRASIEQEATAQGSTSRFLFMIICGHTFRVPGFVETCDAQGFIRWY